MALQRPPSLCIRTSATSTMTILPIPRLACEQCKRRKLRCDKASPCTACADAGLECRTVQRARLPRGKSGRARSQNNKLENRVARIEKLLSRQIEASSEPSQSKHTPVVTKPRVETVGGSNGFKPTRLRDEHVASLVGSEFWEALSVEVQGFAKHWRTQTMKMQMQMQ
jgi:hypothetical protein